MATQLLLLFLATCNEAVVIITDPMDGSLNGWTAVGNSIMPTTSTYCPAFSQCGVISGNSGYVEKTFSSQGYNNVAIRFKMQATGYNADSGDQIIIKTYDNGNKHQIDTPLSADYSGTITLSPPPFAYWNDKSFLKIRFEWAGTGIPTMSSIYINSVQLTGTLITTTTTTTTSTTTTTTTTTTTETPTSSPTTKFPTNTPSTYPTKYPSIGPSISSTSDPSKTPTLYPTVNPSTSPTLYPSVTPSKYPTANPSDTPTLFPSVTPSKHPSSTPTNIPTISPVTSTPSNTPSFQPTKSPIITPPTIKIVPTVSPLNEGGVLDTTNTQRGDEFEFGDTKEDSTNIILIVLCIVAALGTISCIIFVILFLKKQKQFKNVQGKMNERVNSVDVTVTPPAETNNSFVQTGSGEIAMEGLDATKQDDILGETDSEQNVDMYMSDDQVITQRGIVGTVNNTPQGLLNENEPVDVHVDEGHNQNEVHVDDSDDQDEFYGKGTNTKSPGGLDDELYAKGDENHQL